VTIRPASDADVAAIAAIYGHHVLNSTGTFEETPPSAPEIATRIAAVRALRLPYLVAEDDRGRVTGFAYASAFRPRPAYRYTAEDSVYIHPDHMGRGLGKALVAEVIDACAALGVRQMIAVIGDSANAGSIGLHRALGFEDAGVGRAFGFKFGRWVDVVWMQKTLGPGSDAAPTGQGLAL
jgi:L-amino acid N-acyltransferase YncA